MARRAVRRILGAYEARGARRAAADTEDAAEPARFQFGLVPHPDCGRELTQQVAGRLGHIGRAESVGRGRHEVLHQRDCLDDGADPSHIRWRNRRGGVNDDAGSTRLGRLLLEAGEAVGAEPCTLGCCKRRVCCLMEGQSDSDRREPGEGAASDTDGVAN